MRFIAFDIETLKRAPDDHQGDYNLGVTCIGACVVDNENRETRVWHGAEQFGCYRKKMADWEVKEFIEWLKSKKMDVVTWNGAGFDFKVLSCYADGVGEIAWNSIDPFFQMLCEKGYGAGLNAACDGMGVQGKLEGIDGVSATEMWVKSRNAQEKVLGYVRQDAVATANVYEAIINHRALRWITKRGTPSRFVPRMIGERMLTVAESTELPLPDTSWMSNPWRREDFYDWITPFSSLGTN